MKLHPRDELSGLVLDGRGRVAATAIVVAALARRGALLLLSLDQLILVDGGRSAERDAGGVKMDPTTAAANAAAVTALRSFLVRPLPLSGPVVWTD
jgi:hypothetical protein